MDAQWIKSPVGRRVVEHWADPRPTWLWSGDGQTLLWRNLTAPLFNRRSKVKGLPPGREVTPIRGQIARLIRLGSPNRASLSRMQFLAGERPISATCSCVPLLLADGTTGLLVIDVDPIGMDPGDGPLVADAVSEALLPTGADYLLIDDDMQMAGGSPLALRDYSPWVATHGLPEFGEDRTASLQIEAQAVSVTHFKASPGAASLLLFEPLAATPAVDPPQPGYEPIESAEPLLPLGLPPIESAAPAAARADEHWVEPLGESGVGGLSSLFDRLRDDGALFEPLRLDEDFVAPHVAKQRVATPAEGAAPQALSLESMQPASDIAPPMEATSEELSQPPPENVASARPSELAAVEPAEAPPAVGINARKIAEPVQNATEAPAAGAEPPVSLAPLLYRIIARSFAPLSTSATAVAGLPTDLPTAAEQPPIPDMQTAEPVSEARIAAPAEPAATMLADDFVPAPAAIGHERTTENAIEPADPAPADARGTGPLAESTLQQLMAAAGIELPEHSIAATSVPAAVTPDSEGDAVERVSRYNFDELSRILNDRVGKSEGTDLTPARRMAPSVPSATPEGELVTLSGETLVLNRLPLGILVFRDQQVLFANRAITEMVGYESVESLRQAGLAAIFPSASGESSEAGPVNHLTQRGGTLVPVTARLQSVSWQGKAALMLSASATEVRTGHEAAVRAFAELLASTRADGFIEANRAGVLTTVSATARMLIGPADYQWLGRPLLLLIDPADAPALREFLERPARFAETARPAIILRGANADADITLFAQGQAGLVSGYFGYVRERAGARSPALAAPQNEGDTALLARLSRGVRRPLNTVIGFSDLIGSAAFGPVENVRYLEYARDIKTAGLEIATLVDELDDFSRLRDGRYTARPADIDLGGLLESAVVRVRGQASTARVLVRTAISETLPRVRADRASLAQAVLNLLASAIAQTPAGGSVVLSAQVDDAGGIAVNVRDSAGSATDLGERFVVFRDGVGRDGEVLTPVRSSVGLALTRALLAVNASSLTVDPAAGTGTLFSLTIPPENVVLDRNLPPPPMPPAAS